MVTQLQRKAYREDAENGGLFGASVVGELLDYFDKLDPPPQPPKPYGRIYGALREVVAMQNKLERLEATLKAELITPA